MTLSGGRDVAGIAWIRKEDYAALVGIFEDGDVFDSWEQWNERAEELEARMKGDGIVVFRAHLDPSTFAAWCAKRGLRPNREGRLAFGSELASEHYGSSQH